MNSMISFICIAALFCAGAMANNAAILPNGYGGYRAYYTSYVPGVAPYAVSGVPASSVAAAALPGATIAASALPGTTITAAALPGTTITAAALQGATITAAAIPSAAAVQGATAVVPEYYSYPYGYPYLGSYNVYSYVKK
ncbi:hypothetical protein NPIL_228321 [Nephila pilipes]|uniref:Uncharacterized protein n=1 Tax=Nephila pilipes TaxID=299642 RepID=A0A8X6TGV9_NEPPI|nr:hypothetical protein NPIL_228321 [Nephila pilipes]